MHAWVSLLKKIHVCCTILHCLEICFSSFADHWQDLQYPRSSTLQDGRIHDIWNGDALKPLLQEGAFFSHPEHLGLILSTDGVPVFKSSSGSLWPVYLSIANLPPNIRYSSAKTLICGLWFGPKKPPLKALMQPVMNMLMSLYSLGITMLTPVGIKTIRAKLLTGVFDLLAKAPLLNMKQFNGKYGCSTCTHPGTRLTNNARIYLPTTEANPRTHQTIMAAAKEAEVSGVAVRGIKGVSVLATSLDLVESVPVDYMHAVLEGVVRLLLRAWFDFEFLLIPTSGNLLCHTFILSTSVLFCLNWLFLGYRKVEYRSPQSGCMTQRPGKDKQTNVKYNKLSCMPVPFTPFFSFPGHAVSTSNVCPLERFCSPQYILKKKRCHGKIWIIIR